MMLDISNDANRRMTENKEILPLRAMFETTRLKASVY